MTLYIDVASLAIGVLLGSLLAVVAIGVISIAVARKKARR